jgi:hypothetical protein
MTATARAGQHSGVRLKRLGSVAALMVIPVILLRAAQGFEFDPGDLIFLAILLGLLFAAHEVLLRIPNRLAFHAGLAVAVLTGLGQIWVNLAVGIIGTEDDPANLIYAAVIVVAVLGSAIAAFRPAGLAVAMAFTAIVQASTFFVALAAGFGFTGPITIFFTCLWLIAAALFRRSAGVGLGSPR